MATHSSVLARRIPGMWEPGVLPSMGSHRVRHDWSDSRSSSKLFTAYIVQLLSCVRLFVTTWTAACQASLSTTNSRGLNRLMSIESMMPYNHLILRCFLLLRPSIFPASGSFPTSRLFTAGGQSIGVSALASVLPINIQGGFPLGLTSLMSLQSKGLSNVFSDSMVQKYQFFGTQLSSQSNSHIHT